MAKQTIGIGSAANDGTGSTLRAAFDICNDNFTELYDGSGGLLHKIEGTNFTGSLLVGHSTTGTLSSAENNTGVGIGALDALTSGDSNVAIGNLAGSAITTGGSNILIGRAAGDALLEGSSNVAIGHFALSAEDAHGRNTAIGTKALQVQNAGADAYNVAIGFETGKLITTGVANTIIGSFAGDALTTGGNNVVVGYQALSAEDEHGNNVAVGYQALQVLNAGNSGNNVAVGREAGKVVSTGIKNTILGSKAGDLLETGENNIIIGYNSEASAVDVNNEITLGDANITAFRCADQSIAALSDGRDKSDVVESPYGLEFINKLKPVKFTWDFRPEHMSDVKQGKSRVGFIAQDLQEAMPNNDNDILDLVYEISEDRLEAKYGNLIPVMAKAIQELSAEVKELKKQING